MNPVALHPPVSLRPGIADLCIVVARWTLGIVLIYMGATKAANPIEFLKVVRQYDLIEHPFLLNFVAATIPWFEIFCGVVLLLGAWVRGTAVVVLAILALFTTAVALRGFSIREASGLPFCTIKFDCGCGAGEVLVCRKICENLLLMMLSSSLMFFRNHRFCAGRSRP